ncbi:NAD(P)/FAD-dependent oxidoreductase [Glutamicibacter arilaitensis]|uniref:D-amino-acid oxidase n=1 Tax=Glutamicibacter arilaitensis TaxID=256701 RepID=A0A2N7S3P2_9MICC|nr:MULTISPECIES: FAD-dependent oxidoreductase [Glutamicibacter]PMQ20717.1 FAD-dependent oxidoreductase [Glutamicibacter arilaitensis]HCJ55077.1 FAD-binding oxidoreductase [Glutamicibacter sp.]HCM93268.1 FAD-binding oxidoreductase [Glutamicibacter sp.]
MPTASLSDAAQPSARITVIGAGVIGLSTAHELASAGHQVTVIHDQDPLETVSAVAAAIWFPYHSENSQAADLLLRRSLARFEQLAENPETGVDLRYGLNLEGSADEDRSWAQIVTNATEAPSADLPQIAAAGMYATVPVITMSTYLSWLHAQVQAQGVQFIKRNLQSLNDLEGEADLVVLATGLRGAELTGDDQSVYPIRGQVIRLANSPGLANWLCYDEHPHGVSYIIPRRTDIIVGGTDVANDYNLEVDAQTAEDMLSRATGLVPQLAGCEVLEHKVGLRPARETIRLERIDGHAMPVIAAYGHGGAGVTLSWGTAQHVVELLQS